MSATLPNMVNVTVRLFGPAIDMVGCESLAYALVEPASLEGLCEMLGARYPKLGANLAYMRFAVNGEYAEASATLAEGDEVAVIPPVAGG